MILLLYCPRVFRAVQQYPEELRIGGIFDQDQYQLDTLQVRWKDLRQRFYNYCIYDFQIRRRNHPNPYLAFTFSRPAYNFFWTEKAKFFFGSFICGGGVYSTNIIILQNFVKGCLAFLLDTTVWKNEKFKHSQYSQYFLKFSVKTAYNFNYVDLT